MGSSRGVLYGGGDSVFASANSNPFFGSSGIVSFGVNKSRPSFCEPLDQEENGDQYFDEYYFNQSEKKRKLSTNQLEFLEKSFEAEKKMEPERKTQLAKELGLKPRQIAIWFQNRRARWKTKQLENDYEALHASFMALKNDYDTLLKENEKLKIEALHFKSKSRPSDAMLEKALLDITSKDVDSKVASKNEEQHLVKTDLTNVESPRLTNENHSLQVDSGDSSSHAFELDQSDLSQICHVPANSCYGFPVEDHAFSFWSY